MIGDVQDICCNKCSKYLFTEEDLENVYIRENDQENYNYDDKRDIFICDECSVPPEI